MTYLKNSVDLESDIFREASITIITAYGDASESFVQAVSESSINHVSFYF